MKMLSMLILSVILASEARAEQRILPTHYDFPTHGLRSDNGASITGECGNVSDPNLDGTTTCYDPASSVLFDGHIPTLAGLHEKTWAERFIILNPGFRIGYARIDSYIPSSSFIGRTEITVFNCPELQASVHHIDVDYSTSLEPSASFRYLRSIYPTAAVSSCDSLLTVCIPVSINASKLRVEFNSYYYRVESLYIAEIGFYASSSPCPRYTFIPVNWTSIPMRQILPTQYVIPTPRIMAVNGSFVTGKCANVSTPNLDGITTCYDPASSVLFDGHIPTLTGLDGDTWAEKFMVLGDSAYGHSSDDVRLDFSIPYTTVGRAEITMFLCPQWRIGTPSISVYYSAFLSYHFAFHAIPTVFSCNSLVTVCIPVSRTAKKIRVTLDDDDTTAIYIAEIAFHGNSSPCPAYTILPGNWTPNAANMVPTLLGQELRPFFSVLIAFAVVQTAVLLTVGVVIVFKYCKKEVCREEQQQLVEQQLQEQQLVEQQETFEEEEKLYEIVDDQPNELP